MKVKQIEMFYFDDRTFITLSRQLKKELKSLHEWSPENAFDLRLIYEKLELFLSVYFQSKKRDDIDYKTTVRESIAADISMALDSQLTAGVTEEFHREKFKDAYENLYKLLEDLIYQVRAATTS